MICHRYLVSGKVQGVFYRTSAQHQAQSIGLRGWVRNLLDGRVECLACGDAAQLESFENWLKIGPETAKVTNIELMQENNAEIPSSFEVRSTVSAACNR